MQGSQISVSPTQIMNKLGPQNGTRLTRCRGQRQKEAGTPGHGARLQHGPVHHPDHRVGNGRAEDCRYASGGFSKIADPCLGGSKGKPGKNSLVLGVANFEKHELASGYDWFPHATTLQGEKRHVSGWRSLIHKRVCPKKAGPRKEIVFHHPYWET